MKKQDLYNLINERFSTSSTALYDKFRTEQKILADEYFEQIKKEVNITAISEKINEAIDSIRTVNLFGFLSHNAYDGFISSVRRFGDSKHNFEKSMKNSIQMLFSITSTIKTQDSFDHSEMSKKYFSLHDKCVLWYKKENEKLVTLRNELEHVVKVYPNAKKAAKKLEELGLDLSDIEEIKAEKLPEVIKTSVDVCLFNKKGCE